MSRIKQSSRARGGNRGGAGGGYEKTDPDWELKRIQRMRAEYDSLARHWQSTYLKGLSREDARRVVERDVS